MTSCVTPFRPTSAAPFTSLNLVRNPFGELTPAERGELAVVDVRPWVDALQDPAVVVQFIGPCGHGKTTHLLALARALPGAGYVYLPLTGRHPPLPGQRPLLIDEAQRLGRWRRRRVLAGGGPLVLGTHVDLAPHVVRAGLQVITVRVAADRSAERLMQILNRRIEASRLEAGPVPRIELPQAIELRRRYGGDIRRIEHHLYWQFQQRVMGEASWQPVR